MTHPIILSDIKDLLGLDPADMSHDGQISLLISECADFVKTYCGFTTDKEFEGAGYIVSKMARELFSRLGSEGVSKKEYGNISETYDSGGFSSSVISSLNKFRRLRSPSSNENL